VKPDISGSGLGRSLAVYDRSDEDRLGHDSVGGGAEDASDRIWLDSAGLPNKPQTRSITANRVLDTIATLRASSDSEDDGPEAKRIRTAVL